MPRSVEKQKQNKTTKQTKKQENWAENNKWKASKGKVLEEIRGRDVLGVFNEVHLINQYPVMFIELYKGLSYRISHPYSSSQ